jgi:hypothetical protein
MSALQDRPSLLLADRSSPCPPIAGTVRIPRSANSTPPLAQELPSSVPSNRRTEHEEYCVLLLLAYRAHFVCSSAQERNPTPLFSIQRTLWRSRPSQQLPQSQLVTNSFTQQKILTPAFPATSQLFVRSFPQERKSSPLLSGACARFREKCMGGAKLGRNLDCQESLLTFERQCWPRAACSQGFAPPADARCATVVVCTLSLKPRVQSL